MFSWNEEHNIRQLNYNRYRKLTLEGHSISSSMYSYGTTALYAINTDPFGRSYYSKPLGPLIRTDPFTGEEYEAEGWAVKEFMIDNKCQLINKVSADLLVGKSPKIVLGEEKSDVDINEWEDEWEKKHKFPTFLSENALATSAVGDVYVDVSVKDGDVFIKTIRPEYVEPVFEDGELQSLKYAWVVEDKKPKTGNKRIDRLLEKKRFPFTLLRVKEYFKGRIEHSAFVVRVNEITEPISFASIDSELYDKAKNSQNKQFDFKIVTVEGLKLSSEVIVEYTGVDEFFLIHWPNYKLLKWFGQSDNGMVESLQNTLNSRETQLNDVFDKHSDPAMYGPGGFMDEKGNVTMSGGGGRWFPVESGEAPPGYLVWDSHAVEVMEEIKRIYEALLDNTETAPALLGHDSGGIQSGRALMYKLIRSLAMKARKGTYLIDFLQTLFRTIQKVKIVWIDEGGVNVGELPREWKEDEIKGVEITLKENLPIDVQENVKMVAELYSKSLLSLETTISIIAKYLQEVKPDTEVQKILTEQMNKMKQEWESVGARGGFAAEETPMGE